MRPAIAWLLGNVPISLRNRGRVEHAVRSLRCFISFELVTQHPPQRVGRIDRSIDHKMCDMHALGCEFGIERLAQHPPCAHRCSMAVLSGVAAHGGSRRSY